MISKIEGPPNTRLHPTPLRELAHPAAAPSLRSARVKRRPFYLKEMIIVLTGSTASGKTDTAWALVSLHERIVFLENDCFALRKPFDSSNREDLVTLYDQLLLNVQFHRKRGNTDFVITLSPPMAIIFPDMKFQFEALDPQIFPFLLTCTRSEAARRIEERDRGEHQKEKERRWLGEDIQILNDSFPDESVFVRIDTTEIDELSVAEQIRNRIKSRTG